MPHLHLRRLTILVILISGVGASGCGRADGLVDVQGTVTLDGKPLADAIVQFTAASYASGTARPAVGRTNSSGRYWLEYSTGVTGTRPGKYKVTISTFWPSSLTNEEKVIPGNPEKVPNVYNSKSMLTADVPEDGADVDFELKSDAGPVVQPDAPHRGRASWRGRSSLQYCSLSLDSRL
jgi:hypothetical protein